jgi:hypothetical protein
MRIKNYWRIKMSDSKSWEEEHLRVLSQCPSELLAITGKHSNLWKYPKLETIQKVAKLLHQTRQDTLDEVIGLLKDEPIKKRKVFNNGYEKGYGIKSDPACYTRNKLRQQLKQQLTEMKGEV